MYRSVSLTKDDLWIERCFNLPGDGISIYVKEFAFSVDSSILPEIADTHRFVTTMDGIDEDVILYGFCNSRFVRNGALCKDLVSGNID